MDVIRLHWPIHPLKDEAWYEQEKARLKDEDIIAAELDINYEKSVRSIVFKEFQDSHIFEEPFTPNPKLPVIRTLDYGKTCACVFSQKDNFGRVTFFKEIVLIDVANPTDKLGAAIQSYSAEIKCAGFYDHDDPAGSHDNYNNADETSYQIVQKYGINPTHFVSGSDSKRRRNRIDMLKHLLSEFPEGKPKLRFHQSMIHTIEAFRFGYRYDEDPRTREIKDSIKEEHPFEDVMDCVGMTVMEQLTVQSGIDAKVIKSPRIRNKYTGY